MRELVAKSWRAMALGCHSRATNTSTPVLAPSCTLLSTISQPLDRPNCILFHTIARSQLAMLARVSSIARPGFRRCDRSLLSSLRCPSLRFPLWRLMEFDLATFHFGVCADFGILGMRRIRVFLFLNWVRIGFRMGLRFALAL